MRDERIQPSFPRRFYRPAEAAAELGVDAEAIRQAVLRFDGDSDRIQIYYVMTTALRAVWAPREYLEMARVRGEPNTGQVRNAFAEGKAEWWDITDAAQESLLSHEVSIGPGLWLELDPSHAHDLAANPEQEFPLRFFVAPPNQLGPILPRALINVFMDQPRARFGECWILAQDVEAIRSGKGTAEVAQKTLSTQERENMLRLIGVLAEQVGFDLSRHSEAAGKLVPLVESRTLPIGRDTIAKRLKEAFQLLRPKPHPNSD